MRKNARELRRDARKKVEPRELDLNGFFWLILGDTFNPTQQAFIYDAARIKGYMGPAGCAKTSTLAATGLGRSFIQPGSRGLVARYDYNDLMGTTAKRFEEMIDKLPGGVIIDRDKSPPMRWWIAPAVKDAEPSEITFMGLKDSLGSYDFNWAVVDEADECDESRIHEVNTRLRSPGGDYLLGLAFNPPAKTHWLYTACTGRNAQEERVSEPWVKLFLPQSRENCKHLPAHYYEELSKTLPVEMRQRLVDGEWGSTFEGQPVYRSFKAQMHVRDGLPFDPYTPLLRFWDFGYDRPACIWAQVDFVGRLLVLREHLGHQQEATGFARECKAITAVNFQGAHKCIDYGDPAVRQKKDTGQTLAAFAKEGITILFKLSHVDTGVNIVRRQLERIVEGEPAIQFDRKHAPILIDAMKGGYRMNRQGTDPFKDGFYDHLADALRYGIDNIFGGGGGNLVGGAGRELPIGNSGRSGTLEYDPSYDTL